MILCGGPGYSSNFYPGIFPLTSPLTKIEVPIVPMGLGWIGRPMDHPEAFAFTEASMRALRHIHERIPYSSVRDPITESILRRHGLENVLMTGGPAWYSLSDLHAEFRPRGAIRRVVLSDPANNRLYGQSIRLMQEVRRLLPDAEGHLVFHRGLKADEFTPFRRAVPARLLSVFAKILRFHPIDASYGTDRIAFYRDCDLHIGYRVHAHLSFLSIRRPSFLIAEDGRGMGQARGLGVPEVSAFDANAVERATALMMDDVGGDYPGVRGAIRRMRETYPVMRKFLSSLP